MLPHLARPAKAGFFLGPPAGPRAELAGRSSYQPRSPVPASTRRAFLTRSAKSFPGVRAAAPSIRGSSVHDPFHRHRCRHLSSENRARRRRADGVRPSTKPHGHLTPEAGLVRAGSRCVVATPSPLTLRPRRADGHVRRRRDRPLRPDARSRPVRLDRPAPATGHAVERWPRSSRSTRACARAIPICLLSSACSNGGLHRPQDAVRLARHEPGILPPLRHGRCCPRISCA